MPLQIYRRTSWGSARGGESSKHLSILISAHSVKVFIGITPTCAIRRRCFAISSYRNASIQSIRCLLAVRMTLRELHSFIQSTEDVNRPTMVKHSALMSVSTLVIQERDRSQFLCPRHLALDVSYSLILESRTKTRPSHHSSPRALLISSFSSSTKPSNMRADVPSRSFTARTTIPRHAKDDS